MKSPSCSLLHTWHLSTASPGAWSGRPAKGLRSLLQGNCAGAGTKQPSGSRKRAKQVSIAWRHPHQHGGRWAGKHRCCGSSRRCSSRQRARGCFCGSASHHSAGLGEQVHLLQRPGRVGGGFSSSAQSSSCGASAWGAGVTPACLGAIRRQRREFIVVALGARRCVRCGRGGAVARCSRWGWRWRGGAARGYWGAQKR